MKRVSNVTIRKRIVTVFIFALILFLSLGVRLAYVQFVIGAELTDKAQASWSRDIHFEAERGKILDKHDEVLVENVSAPTVMLVPRQISNQEEVAKTLSKILDLTEGEMLEYVQKNTSIVRFSEGRKISEKQALAIQMLNFDGVYIAKDTKRHYPNDAYLSHVLGFSGIDNQGLMGLELYHDDKLSGDRGRLSFYSDAKGKRLPDLADTYQAPVDGLDLKLTIDAKVQTIIERELDIAEATYQPDGALAIAVDPKTGAVLGMSSRPNFHPNEYQAVDTSVYDRNLPIWSTYEPGSTFKIITLAAALEEGVVDLHEDEYFDSGSIKVGGAKLRCWKHGGHGQQTYLEVVQNSCNPGFVTLGLALGKETLFSYIDAFGFGKKTGIDLTGEASGILFDLDQVGPVELATTAFGQGVSVTPIQQVMAVSAAVNGGYLYQPYVVDQFIDPVTREIVEAYEPVYKGQVITEETSVKVRDALEGVVAYGTGRGAFVEGYRVGGKTGTAQKVGESGRYLENNHVVSFIGFAPADDPEIVVYLAIDNPKNTVQFGGVVAAPIVGNIMEDGLRAMGVETRDDGLDKDYQWPDLPLVEVPDLIGLERKDMYDYMLNLTIEATGEGSTIVDQAPEPGTKITSGETVRLYFSNLD